MRNSRQKAPTRVNRTPPSASLKLQVIGMPDDVRMRLSDVRAAILYLGLSGILAWPVLGGNSNGLRRYAGQYSGTGLLMLLKEYLLQECQSRLRGPLAVGLPAAAGEQVSAAGLVALG